jgi:hypothetical protein
MQQESMENETIAVHLIGLGTGTPQKRVQRSNNKQVPNMK